jgi:predicted nucleotidyltransferase
MNFGLNEQILAAIKNIFIQYSDIEWAKIFGSRAKGNYRPYSDIDISLGGDISQSTLGLISLDLDELSTPYRFDVNVYKKINHNKLKEHIDRAGIVFYKKEENEN